MLARQVRTLVRDLPQIKCTRPFRPFFCVRMRTSQALISALRRAQLTVPATRSGRRRRTDLRRYLSGCSSRMVSVPPADALALEVVALFELGSSRRFADPAGNEKLRRHFITAGGANSVADRGHRRPLQRSGGLNELFDVEPERAMLTAPAPTAHRDGPKAFVPFRVRFEERYRRPGFSEGENRSEVHPAVEFRRDRRVEPPPGMGASHRSGT